MKYTRSIFSFSLHFLGILCFELKLLELLPAREDTEQDDDVKDNLVEENSTGCHGNGMGYAKDDDESK